MKITNLTLCDFIRLRVSKIRELEIDFTHDDTHLIIGSNGSGKSSILHELFPTPSIKSSFGKTGFKSLSLQHHNEIYKLTYETGVGHHFFKGTTNLNLGKTNDIQRELIEEHFGITNDIHAILKCSLRICDMIPSQRKKILMDLNPIDISLFISKYQKVHKDVVAYTNNLERLYNRQKQLLMQKLPEQQYQHMLIRKNELENQEKILLIWITSVTNELEKYPEQCGLTEISENIRKQIREIFRNLPKYSEVNKRTFETDVAVYASQCELLTSELQDIEQVLEKTVNTLNKYEQRKQSFEDTTNDVTNELLILKEKSQAFVFDEDLNTLSREQIDEVVALSQKLHDILNELTYIEYTHVVSKEEVNRLYRETIDLRSKLTNEASEIALLRKKKEDIAQTIKNYKVDTSCTKDQCELFHTYDSLMSKRREELRQVNEQIQQLEEINAVSKKEYTIVSEAYNTQIRLWKHIDAVFQLIERTPIEKQFNNAWILKRIKEEPVLFIKDVNEYIIQCEQYLEYCTINERIQELNLINTSLESKKQTSKELLAYEIRIQTEQLTMLRNKQITKEEQIRSIVQRKRVLEEFRTIHRESHQLYDMIQEIESCCIIKASREYLMKLHDVMNRLLQTTRTELSEVSTIVHEQELLLARLDSEVDSVIADLKPRLEDARIVEKSLLELPIKYTKDFINNIITTANYFISEIMTYPLHLIPIGEHEECDFSFPVVIENEVKTKDITSCSDGQKTIIQLAFNLALIVELRFNDYPVACDEIDRTLDTTHSRRLTDLLLSLIQNKIIGQLFIVGHHSSMLNKFNNSGNTTVLNSENIILPDVYNTHTRLVYG